MNSRNKMNDTMFFVKSIQKVIAIEPNVLSIAKFQCLAACKVIFLS